MSLFKEEKKVGDFIISIDDVSYVKKEKEKQTGRYPF